MVTHGNLLHNLEMIHRGFRIDPKGMGVTWLPMYHDMGLIGGILEPMFAGGPATLMSPVCLPAAAGKLAAGDHAVPGHDQRRPQLRL